MPALLPAPMPAFPCSTSRTAGKRSRTSSTVPSVDPWSTTIASRPATDSRQRPSHGSAFHVTTTTETSPWLSGIEDRRPAQALPEEHEQAGDGEQERQQEEQEPRGE